jgi:superfamily II DNA or RNA helicase
MLVAKQHKKLLLNLNDPDRILGIVPGAKRVNIKGHDIVSVDHDQDTVRVLRNMGIQAPGPILHYYDWPGRWPPYVHQRETAEFATLSPRAFILNDMGTGKTVSVLWAFDYLRKIGTVDWALVISPLSTLERTWADEVFRNFPDMSYGVVYGTPDRKKKIARDSYDIYIINHDGIKNKELLDIFARKPGNGLIIVDELASFRNASTDRWKCLNLLVNGNAKAGIAPKEWVWGLTGTPIPNEPTDAWAQCKLIAPGSVPKYFNAFRDLTMRQITQYKWFAKNDALDTVYRYMQPAIRFSREQCIDLPPTTYMDRAVELTPEQSKMYKQMVAQFRAEYGSGQITATNEAVKLGKLLQICCLSYDTDVLTDFGWVPISRVTPEHRVWDGVEWVTQKGAVLMGFKPTVVCAGVEMTPDHLVLSTEGWVEAKEFNHGYASKRLDRASVRLPDGYAARGQQRGREQEGAVGVRMPLRPDSDAGEPVPARQEPLDGSELWLSAREPDAQNVEDPPLPDLGEHAPPLRRPARQRLGQLWGSWSNCLRKLGGIVRRVLAGCEGWVRPTLDTRPAGQRRPLFAGELPMGNAERTSTQPQVEQVSGHAERLDDVGGSRHGVWGQACNPGREVGQVQVAAGKSAGNWVYDLINCGPRNRFVVRGSDGGLLIVHNCGVAYGPDGDVVIPAKPRIDTVLEIIEEASAKVIVFVPLTGALNALADEIGKHYPVAVVHGGVSKSQRDDIFHDFMQPHGVRVLVAQPGTMAHGLTLTAANTIVWFAPTNSAETYQQANARIVRPGQTRNTLIVRVQGSDIERKMYERLERRESMQGTLLDMFK